MPEPSAVGWVLYEFARFITESWDDEFPGHPFTVDPESSRLAIAADIADLIAANRYVDAHGIAEQTQGGERLAAALLARAQPMSRDERHEQAVAAAVATIPAFDSDTDDVRAGIDAYLRSLADQGDPLVRLIEVVEWLEGQYVPAMAAAVQRRFATEQRREQS